MCIRTYKNTRPVSPYSPTRFSIHLLKLFSFSTFPFLVRTEDSPTLQILKKHGISMLPDDADNTIINSALQSGRKLILSDAGKQLILNYPKTAKSGASSTSSSAVVTHSDFIKSESGAMKRKSPAVLVPTIQSKTGALKTNKVIKILSAEEFNKMCAGKMTNAFKKLPTDALTSNSSGFRWILTLVELLNDIDVFFVKSVSDSRHCNQIWRTWRRSTITNEPSWIKAKLIQCQL